MNDRNNKVKQRLLFISILEETLAYVRAYEQLGRYGYRYLCLDIEWSYLIHVHGPGVGELTLGT